jgi:hypothetical protein
VGVSVDDVVIGAVPSGILILSMVGDAA